MSSLMEVEFSIPEGFQSEAGWLFINILSKDIKTFIAIINWIPELFLAQCSIYLCSFLFNLHNNHAKYRGVATYFESDEEV